MNKSFYIRQVLYVEKLKLIYEKANLYGLEIYFPTNPRKWKIFGKALKKSPKYQAMVNRISNEATKEMKKQNE